MNRGVFVLAVDQGTTGSRAILYDKNASVVSSAYQEFPQFFPMPGWVEHDAEKIWQSVHTVIKKTVSNARVKSSAIAAIGLTNQRETVIFWDSRTGKPISRAIVWQDRRTAADCERLKKTGAEKTIRQKTGLVLDPYFSATKISWILKNVPGIGQKIRSGNVRFGTVDSWILWKLTRGKVHATDHTNASRTLLYNIHARQWDQSLLKLFRIPPSILPSVQNSGETFGTTSCGGGIPEGISIHSIMGDQQSALYGQSCYNAGQVKNTYGTGCFVVMNLGSKKPKRIPYGLLGTIACNEEGEPVYALEGSVFMGGAVLQWLRDSLKFFKKASESESLIAKLRSNGGVTLVPAFTGLGSPYWNPYARGMISGMTRGTTAEHITRAALESIAQQSADVIEVMQKMVPGIRELRVDGGATANRFLMQFQSDLLRIPLLVSSQSESTAWGTAKLAGKSAGVWGAGAKIEHKIKYRKYQPKMRDGQRKILRSTWKKEVQRALF